MDENRRLREGNSRRGKRVKVSSSEEEEEEEPRAPAFKWHTTKRMLSIVSVLEMLASGMLLSGWVAAVGALFGYCLGRCGWRGASLLLVFLFDFYLLYGTYHIASRCTLDTLALFFGHVHLHLHIPRFDTALARAPFTQHSTTCLRKHVLNTRSFVTTSGFPLHS